MRFTEKWISYAFACKSFFQKLFSCYYFAVGPKAGTAGKQKALKSCDFKAFAGGGRWIRSLAIMFLEIFFV